MDVSPALVPRLVDRRSSVIALSGLLLLFGVLIAEESHKITKQWYGGFSAAYDASAAMRHGANPYTIGHAGVSYVYPPLYAFLFTPLLRFSMQSAARWIMLLDAGFVFLAMLFLARLMLSRLAGPVTRSRTMLVALSASLILTVPIRNEFHGLESNAPVLLCFVLALFWIDRHPVLAGLALALAINIKYLPLVLLPYLALRRRWAATAAALLWTVALAMLPAFATGWSTNLHYIRIAAAGLVHLTGGGASDAGAAARVPTLAQDTSLSITSGLARLTLLRHWPSAAAPAIAGSVSVLWAASVLAMYRFRRLPSIRWPSARWQGTFPYRELFPVEWAGLIATLLALGPNTQDRLLLLAAFPVTLAMALVWCPSPRRSTGTLASGTIILFLGLLLPISIMGHYRTQIWRAAGVPGWLVLIGSGLILWSALRCVRRADGPTVGQLNAEPELRLFSGT